MKNVYIGKLPKIVEKYNNIIHRAINIKSVNVKPKSCIIYPLKFNTKNPELEAIDYMLESHNINIYFQKVTDQICFGKN